MDPDETLALIQHALSADCCHDEVDGWVDALRCWLDKGGFQPLWEKHPLAASYYRSRIATIKHQENAQ